MSSVKTRSSSPRLKMKEAVIERRGSSNSLLRSVIRKNMAVSSSERLEMSSELDSAPPSNEKRVRRLIRTKKLIRKPAIDVDDTTSSGSLPSRRFEDETHEDSCSLPHAYFEDTPPREKLLKRGITRFGLKQLMKDNDNDDYDPESTKENDSSLYSPSSPTRGLIRNARRSSVRRPNNNIYQTILRDWVDNENGHQSKSYSISQSKSLVSNASTDPSLSMMEEEQHSSTDKAARPSSEATNISDFLPEIESTRLAEGFQEPNNVNSRNEVNRQSTSRMPISRSDKNVVEPPEVYTGEEDDDVLTELPDIPRATTRRGGRRRRTRLTTIKHQQKQQQLGNDELVDRNEMFDEVDDENADKNTNKPKKTKKKRSKYQLTESDMRSRIPHGEWSTKYQVSSPFHSLLSRKEIKGIYETPNMDDDPLHPNPNSFLSDIDDKELNVLQTVSSDIQKSIECKILEMSSNDDDVNFTLQDTVNLLQTYGIVEANCTRTELRFKMRNLLNKSDMEGLFGESVKKIPVNADNVKL